jgi:GTP-binding protein
VRVDDDGFVMADIPGLIEGAADGVGLGHAFLRHVERTRLLIHLIDMSGSEGRDPLEDYAIINRELAKYGNLAEKPQIIAANKMDLPDAPEFLALFRQAHPEIEVFEISALNRQGLTPLLRRVRAMLAELPEPEPFFETYVLPDPGDQGPAFEIVKDADVYCVSGPLVDRLLSNIDFYDDESMAYFQRSLRAMGVIDALREQGAKDGDTVRMDDLEFDFID